MEDWERGRERERAIANLPEFPTDDHATSIFAPAHNPSAPSAMVSFRLSFFRACLILSLCLFLAIGVAHAAEAGEEADGQQVPVTNDDAAAEAAAEAAADAAADEALGQIDDEDDGDAGALDEDADLARYDPEMRHPLSVMPPSSSDVRIGYSFISGLSSSPAPSSGDASDDVSPLITLGTEVKLILSIANEGKNLFNVWGIMGSLNRADKFAVHIQNFSYSLINHTMPPGGELSSTYRFTPNERHDVRPFQLAITIFYEARSSISGNAIAGHSTTFYNATVATKPGPQIVSNTLFMFFFALFVAAVAAAVFIYKKSIEQQENQKDNSSSTSTRDTSSIQKDSSNPTDPSKNEWLEGALGINKPGSGKAKRKSKDKKN